MPQKTRREYPTMQNQENIAAKNQSVVKTLMLIEHLAQMRTPQRLQDISKALQLNASTLTRFLSTLKNLGYVDQEPDTSKYYLTLRICSVANQVSSNFEIRDQIRPFLKTISDTLKESVCYAIEQDMSVVYIEVIQGPNQALKITNRIGSRAPMYCTGIGKLLLLEHDEAYIDKMIERDGMQQFTEHTLLTKEDLLKELETVRSNDYALDNEECDLGVSCIAFPLRDYSGKIIGGLSISGPTFHIQNLIIPKNISYLKKMSLLISQKIGYMEGAD